MNRFAYLAVCAIALVAIVAARPLPASATPFSDVPASHWAADAIQTLAADGIIAGYPNGKFLGNRSMTRNEMAVIIARAIAKIQAEGGASRADLDKLSKLMDAYKDELDGMGVRVTALEDKISALDKATQFAQRFAIHGTLYSAYSQRNQPVNPITVAGAFARADAVQNFTDSFIETDASNDPYYGRLGPDVILPRSQWEFTASYAVTPNVVVSMPVKILDYNYGGYRQQQTGIGINPTIDVSVPNFNGVKGLDIRIGQLENLKGSLTGLTFSPPDNFHIAYTDPYRPFPQGVDVTGTLFNYLDVQVYGYRLDPVGVNSGPFGPNTGITSNIFLGPYYFQQTSNSYGSAPTTDTFNAGTSPLASVSLTSNAQPGTIFISYFLGPGCVSGCFFTAANQAGEPSFTYVQTANQVVFGSVLPAGSTVAITYQGFSVSANTFPKRYDVGGRAVWRVPGIPSGTIGLSFNRIFDLRGDSAAAGNTVFFQTASIPNQIVSDTVFGMDFTLPLAYAWGPVQTPVLFGEISQSKYTRDFQRIPAASDSAGVIGIRFKLLGGDQTFTYQSVGPFWIDGAQFMWSGQAPALFAFYNYPQLPGPFGIGNNFILNSQVDAAAIAGGNPGTLAANGSFPNGTFAFPLFSQFKAQGPYWYSTYAPNTRGASAQLNFPLKVGTLGAKLRLSGQSLREIRPNSLTTAILGPAFVSTVAERYDALTGGFTVDLPVFDRKATVNFDALFERLQRPDSTKFVYAADPLLGLAAFNPLGSAELTGTGSVVFFYPNHVNLRHLVGSGSVALPITAALTANASYVDQRYGGDALSSTLSQNISEKKTALSVGVLYNIPNTNSSINTFFTRYEYKDDVLPSYNWTQNRQNLYFTVKF
ncbi:MAG TPA: S-layer homology domain-containing protein [Candidatus Tumulicola sp.]|nr:S-layer homology domain-containing protein [Candidatus Tumulicola sp.]